MRSIWLLTVMSGASAIALAAPPLRLSDLEQMLPQSALASAQLALHRARTARLEAGSMLGGISLVGGSAYTHGSEIVDIDRVRDIDLLGADIGLRIPVLASRRSYIRERLSNELAQAQADFDLAQAQRRMLRELRVAYVNAWAATQRVNLANELLALRLRALPVLAERTRSALLLESDRLEFQSAFVMAERDAVTAQMEVQSGAGQIAALTALPAAAISVMRPAPVELCHGGDAGVDPELQYLDRALALRSEWPERNALDQVETTLRINANRITDQGSARDAGTANIAFTFNMPLGALQQRRALARADAAEAQALQYRREARLAEIDSARLRLAQRQDASRRLVAFAGSRLAAAESAVRERELRAARLAGDTQEQLLQARIGRYAAARAALDAEVETMLMQIDAAESGLCAAKVESLRAIYLWHDAERLASVAPSGRSQHGALGIDRVLLSLNARELREARVNPAALAARIAKLREQGYAVELLLGEPTWLLTKGRPALLRTIGDLAVFDFDALHLDLETTQLDARHGSEEKLLEELLETLREAKRRSPWPLGLSVHPRQLQVQLGRANSRRPFGNALQDLDVETTLMTYVANPERVVAIVRDALSSLPQLRYRVALSLERSLGRDESLGFLAQQEQRARLERIESSLRGPQFHGLVLQPEPGEFGMFAQRPGDP
ncbi:MAG: hypothetical protein R3E77_13730 [Steroidobacteraceae bacterium]